MRRTLSFTCLLSVSAFCLIGLGTQTSAQQPPQINFPQIGFPEKNTNYLAQASAITANVKEIAEKITVRIDAPRENGSGVIVAHQGNNYYILTAKHVVEKEREYQIVTPDGEVYPVDYTTVKKIDGVDLAVLQFQSEKAYQVATLVDYGNKESLASQAEDSDETIRQRQIAEQLSQEFQTGKRPWQDFRLFRSPLWVFVYGWEGINGSPQPRFTAGKYYKSKLDENTLSSGDENSYSSSGLDTDSYSAISPLNSGIVDNIFTYSNLNYDVVYTSPTFGGMSGGPVLDVQGKVSAIHAAAEGGRAGFSEVQLGYSTGVLIGTFLRLANITGINPQWLNIEQPALPTITLEENDFIVENLFNLTPPKSNATSTDWLNYGNQLWRLFRYEQAITAFDRAIELKPTLAEAYYLKGKTLERLSGDVGLSNVTLNQNSQAQTNNQEKIQQGLQLQKQHLQTIQAAFDEYKKATEVQPNFYQAWREQGDLLRQLPLIQSQLQQSEQLSSYTGTVSNEELNQTINNNERNEFEILSRNLEYFKVSLQNKKAGYSQALEAYNKAIAINSEDSYLYSRQGDILFKLDSCPAAIDSLNKAIAINPLGLFYRQRAIVYLALEELEKAEADYNRYHELDPTSYNSDTLKSVFSNRSYLSQFLQMDKLQKQQLLQLTKGSDVTLDYPGDCLSNVSNK